MPLAVEETGIAPPLDFVQKLLSAQRHCNLRTTAISKTKQKDQIKRRLPGEFISQNEHSQQYFWLRSLFKSSQEFFTSVSAAHDLLFRKIIWKNQFASKNRKYRIFKKKHPRRHSRVCCSLSESCSKTVRG